MGRRGMAAESKCGTSVHCQIHLNELTNMVYKLSKFNSIAHATRFAGRTKAEEFLNWIRIEIRKTKGSFVTVH